MEDMKNFLSYYFTMIEGRITHHPDEVLWAAVFGVVFAFVAGIIVELIFKPFRHWWGKRKELKKLYSFIGKSSSLKQKEERDKVLGGRPFNDYYYKRDEDALIDKCLENKKNVLVIGPPLMGKSRAVYQALIKLNKPQRIAIPKHIRINPETLQLPKKTQFIFIDDLQGFVKQENFEHLFTTARENNIVIVAACRSGEDYKRVTSSMLDKNMPMETIFENTIELPRISEEAGEEIANNVNNVRILWDSFKFKFDHTPGSIFMNLEEMENRWSNCSDDEQAVLRAIRSLYLCGMYEENLLFPLEWIKITAKKVGLAKAAYEWTPLLEGLRDKEFISLEKDKIWAKDEVYLERIVTPLVGGEILDVSEDAVTTFSGIPEVLFRLANRAYSDGIIVLEKAEYMKIAIKAYEAALKVWTLKSFPKDYAMAQHSLAAAYRRLAEVKDKHENCKKAIEASTEALKVRTLKDCPMDYAMTQNNLGNPFRTLAEVADKAWNCERAFNAYMEALKVFEKEGLTEPCRIVEGNLVRLRDFCGEHTP